jgi:hypothetical protein
MGFRTSRVSSSNFSRVSLNLMAGVAFRALKLFIVTELTLVSNHSALSQFETRLKHQYAIVR